MLFVGEPPRDAFPCFVLGKALTRYDITPVHRQKPSLLEWPRLVAASDVVVARCYDGPGRGLGRWLAGAARVGRPLLRWWGGSDVLRCLRDPEAADNARWLDRYVRANVATAPHLVEELGSLGIRARFIPSVPATPPPAAEPRGPLPRAALVYLPDSNPALYGESAVREAIRANRDFTFFVVADREHRFAGEPNVRSLGWVSDLTEIYDQVGVLLRITRHDGMPRMVLEALQRGKHVIYAWPFPGCWRAVNAGEVNAGFQRARERSGLNEAGMRAVKPFVEPDPAGTFASLIRGQHSA